MLTMLNFDNIRPVIMKYRGILAVVMMVLIGVSGIGFYLIDENAKNNITVDEDLLRLHIVANSDYSLDQKIKLMLRDEMICLLRNDLEAVADKGQAIEKVRAALPEIEKSCNDFLQAKGIDYGAQVLLEPANFPDRQYGNLFVPAGKYDALRIVLGKGEGKNWWCVLFPPLCFIDLTSEVETVDVMAGNTTPPQENKIEMRWRILDWFK
jgi:stage II sporulation protein R